MKQPKSIQISIPTPCQEDWSKMTPREQGRFCSSCQKCVVDFTGYTDEQLYTYLLAHKNERICGRVLTPQTNRAIQLPAQPHSTLYKWIVTAGLVSVFTSAPDNKTFAKAPFSHEITEDSSPGDKKSKNGSTTEDTYTLKGSIIGDDGEPVIGATLVFKKNDMEEGRTHTTIDGTFSIELKDGNYLLYASHEAYHLIDIIVLKQKEYNNGERLKLTMQKIQPVLGMVSCEFLWKWEWEYTRIPYVSPPQD